MVGEDKAMLWHRPGEGRLGHILRAGSKVEFDDWL